MDRGSYVPILMYHQVAADSEIRKPGGRYVLAASDFEEQMELLTHLNYSTVTLSDFVAYAKGETSLPMKPVIITFDDGHESNYKVAYPILKRFALTAAFFVVVSHLDSPGSLTVKQMEEMNAEGMSIQSHTLTHPYLIKLDKGQMERELSESKGCWRNNWVRLSVFCLFLMVYTIRLSRRLLVKQATSLCLHLTWDSTTGRVTHIP